MIHSALFHLARIQTLFSTHVQVINLWIFNRHDAWLGIIGCLFCRLWRGKAQAKNKDEWGTGVVEGIAAPESANNAVSGPSMIPLLTLGIPGSTIAAVLIGMFLVNGLQVGPQIFATEPPLFVAGQMMSPREFIFGVFAAGLVGIGAYAIIGYFCCALDW